MTFSYIGMREKGPTLPDRGAVVEDVPANADKGQGGLTGQPSQTVQNGTIVQCRPTLGPLMAGSVVFWSPTLVVVRLMGSGRVVRLTGEARATAQPARSLFVYFSATVAHDS